MTHDLEYNALTCWSAELREIYNIPKHIPDCAWVPKGTIRVGEPVFDASSEDLAQGKIAFTLPVEFLVPFRWVGATFTLEKPDG